MSGTHLVVKSSATKPGMGAPPEMAPTVPLALVMGALGASRLPSSSRLCGWNALCPRVRMDARSNLDAWGAIEDGR